MPVIKAIIFDFDGVLFDTEPLHCSMFQEVLRAEGIVLTSDQYHAAYVGLTDEACFRAVLKDDKTAISHVAIDRLVQDKTDLMQRALRASLPRLPGVMEFVSDAYISRRLAIASGALEDPNWAIHAHHALDAGDDGARGLGATAGSAGPPLRRRGRAGRGGLSTAWSLAGAPRR